LKTSLSLADADKRIGERLKQRLGLDSLSATVSFALRHLGATYGVINTGTPDAVTHPTTVEGGGVGDRPPASEREPWGHGAKGIISDPFKLAAKDMGRPVAFVSFKKAVMDAYAPIDDPTERVYVEYSASLSKQMGVPVPPGVISWHLSGHKRWRRLVALAKHAIENHGRAVFQAAAESLYDGDPKPMIDLLYLRR